MNHIGKHIETQPQRQLSQNLDTQNQNYLHGQIALERNERPCGGLFYKFRRPESIYYCFFQAPAPADVKPKDVPVSKPFSTRMQWGYNHLHSANVVTDTDQTETHFLLTFSNTCKQLDTQSDYTHIQEVFPLYVLVPLEWGMLNCSGGCRLSKHTRTQTCIHSLINTLISTHMQVTYLLTLLTLDTPTFASQPTPTLSSCLAKGTSTHIFPV